MSASYGTPFQGHTKQSWIVTFLKVDDSRGKPRNVSLLGTAQGHREWVIWWTIIAPWWWLLIHKVVTRHSPMGGGVWIGKFIVKFYKIQDLTRSKGGTSLDDWGNGPWPDSKFCLPSSTISKSRKIEALWHISSLGLLIE